MTEKSISSAHHLGKTWGLATGLLLLLGVYAFALQGTIVGVQVLRNADRFDVDIHVPRGPYTAATKGKAPAVAETGAGFSVRIRRPSSAAPAMTPASRKWTLFASLNSRKTGPPAIEYKLSLSLEG